MKEKLTLESHVTPVCMWSPKSKVTVPSKKVNQDADGLFVFLIRNAVHPPGGSSTMKNVDIIYDAKHRSYIHIPKIKADLTSTFLKLNADLKLTFMNLDLDLTSAPQMINTNLNSAVL